MSLMLDMAAVNAECAADVSVAKPSFWRFLEQRVDRCFQVRDYHLSKVICVAFWHRKLSRRE